MPAVKGVTSTAAGQVTQNVLSGSVYEYAPFNAYVEFGLVDEATGEQRVTVLSGSDTICEEAPVSRQARVPVYPDDFDLTDMVRAGERIVIRVRNTGAAARNLFWTVRLTPV